jgi:hypothetical protein
MLHGDAPVLWSSCEQILPLAVAERLVGHLVPSEPRCSMFMLTASQDSMQLNVQPDDSHEKTGGMRY